jgi:hypothetical protein
MSGFARILGVLLLAAFAAGSVVHAASTASMTGMSIGVETMHMVGCEDRGAANDPACEIACISSSPASLSENRALAARPSTGLPRTGFDRLSGRDGPPELHPPRGFA